MISPHYCYFSESGPTSTVFHGWPLGLSLECGTDIWSPKSLWSQEWHYLIFITLFITHFAILKSKVLSVSYLDYSDKHLLLQMGRKTAHQHSSLWPQGLSAYMGGRGKSGDYIHQSTDSHGTYLILKGAFYLINWSVTKYDVWQGGVS